VCASLERHVHHYLVGDAFLAIIGKVEGLSRLVNSSHRPERFAERCSQHASLGNNVSDVLSRGHVKGRIANAYAVGRELLAAIVDYLDGQEG
jgi:hypothetical protein